MFAPLTSRPPSAPRVTTRLRALLALSIALLQIIGALHFWLVPHAFSAALGGVVHVHAAPSSETRALSSGHATAGSGSSIIAGAPGCSTDSCPFADAPAGTPLAENPGAAAEVSFGQPVLLAAASGSARPRARVLSNAPKTSPPS